MFELYTGFTLFQVTKSIQNMVNPWIDCSQSPYFSVGFSRPVRFDGTAAIAAILVCKSERDLGRVSKLPWGARVGVSIPHPNSTSLPSVV